MSGTFNNSLDNSEVPVKETAKSQMPYYQSVEQANEMKLYMENLKLLKEVEGYADTDIITMKVGTRVAKVPIKKLVPRLSEFDRVRQIVIAKLNDLTDDELRPWMAKFATDNVFELSSRIANYSLDAKRRDDAKKFFNVWDGAFNVKKADRSGDINIFA